MRKTGLTLLALVVTSLAWTIPYVEEVHVVEVQKRQADVSQLLQLASLAGITQLPTDPAVLLELGPVANSLASALPTSSVLAVLLTAAPSGFVSSIVNDPSYANSFESAFAAGSSPAWFTSLPTGVKSYLHTYSGFGGLATAAGAVKAVTESANSALLSGGTSTDIRASNPSGSSGASAASTASAASATGTSSGISMMTTGSSASAASAISASSTGVATKSATSVSTPATSSSGGTATSASAKAGAARPSGAIAAGVAGAIGIFGAAIAL